MTKILVVEDDRTLRETLSYNLRAEDFAVVEATDGRSAVEQARRETPDLILLDLMLPAASGIDVCRTVRSFSSVPIIILTAKDDEIDRVLGLEIGADDYVTKPFSLRELLARIRANLRRVQLDRGETRAGVLRHEDIRVDTESRQVTVGDRNVALQPKEFDLLVFLLRHSGTVLTRERLLASVWGHEFVGERTVDVHVRRVRAKLENAGAGSPIRTVHGVGYALGARQESKV